MNGKPRLSGQTAGRQLSLDLAADTGTDSDDFVVGNANRQAYAMVQTWPEWPHRIALIYGPKDSGKSHLVANWAERSRATIVAPSQISAALPGAIGAENDLKCFVVEDIHRNGLDEVGLFHFINHAVESESYLLLTSRLSPHYLKIGLADLGSRLRAAYTAEIALPDGELLEGLLVKLFSDRQIDFPPQATAYALGRMERTYASATRLVNAVDRMSLEEGKRITVPLLRRYFESIDASS